MPLLDILVYPDPRLRRRASDVSLFDDALKQFVTDMADTMYAAPGIGLAATQVDDLRRIVVIDVSEDRRDLKVFINPRIVEKDGTQIYEEGCLSIPGVYAEVDRAEHIRVEALDADGASFELEASGLLAVCIQHEIDHLDGKVFVDYLSRLKQDRIRKRMVKEHAMQPITRETATAAQGAM